MRLFKSVMKYFAFPLSFCYCIVLLFIQIKAESGLATSLTLIILSFAAIANFVLSAFTIRATKLVLDMGIDLAKSLSEIANLTLDASNALKSDIAELLKEFDEYRAKGSNWTPPNKNRVN